MSRDDRKSGIMKPIIIGVSISVLTALILSYFGLEKKTSSDKTQPFATSTEVELRQRQAELEERIRQLSEQDIARRQSELDDKLRRYEETINDARTQEEQNSYQLQVSYPDISGTWQDPNTGASYLIYQNNELFTIKEISFGVITAVGEGSITGRSAKFSYTTFLGTYGQGRITISDNGNQLSCVFTDLVSQVTLNINLYR